MASLFPWFIFLRICLSRLLRVFIALAVGTHMAKLQRQAAAQDLSHYSVPIEQLTLACKKLDQD
jgi:hypothetical protein